MKAKENGGFTLIELIVVMALLLVIATPIATLFYSVYNSYHQQTDYISAQGSARQAMTSMVDDLRRFNDKNTSVVDGVLYINSNICYKKSDKGLLRIEKDKTAMDNQREKEIVSAQKLSKAVFAQVGDTISILLGIKYGKGQLKELELDTSFTKRG